MRSHLSRASALVGLGLWLVGCGSSSPTSPSVTPTPTPAPVAQVLLEGSVTEMTPMVLFIVGSFTTTAVGRLDVTVDWTVSSDNVDVYVTRGTCSVDQLNAGTCILAVSSESTTSKPERLAVTGLAVGSYTLLIGNRGPAVESASYQVVHTH